MFALLGIAEVVALLIAGGFVAPMFIVPSRRGGPILFARHVEINYDKWPAVLLVAAHGGFAAWLVGLITEPPFSSLEAGPLALQWHIGGIFGSRTGPTALTDIDQKPFVQRFHPKFHITAMFAVGFPMLAYAMVGRLTLRGFAEGFVLVALCCVLAAVQSTNDLVIPIRGRKKPLVFVFSTWSLSRKHPAITHAQLCAVADRITELVMDANAQAARRRFA